MWRMFVVTDSPFFGSIYSFLVKYEKKFYRFIFTFYNTGTKIKIYKFSYDDVLDLELEESLKLYTK